MPQVLALKPNDKPETIFSPRDFEELIDKHMGFDLARFYRSQIEQLSECIRDLSNYIDDKDISEEIEEVLKVNGY